MRPSESLEQGGVALSDQNGKYAYLGQVYGLHRVDLDLHAEDPSRVERLRRVLSDETEGSVMPKGTTHILVVAGYDGHYWRLALQRRDRGDT